jgi:hypothetical protein
MVICDAEYKVYFVNTNIYGLDRPTYRAQGI